MMCIQYTVIENPNARYTMCNDIIHMPDIKVLQHQTPPQQSLICILFMNDGEGQTMMGAT